MTESVTLPYYAVIFTSELAEEHTGYEAMAEEVLTLAEQQPGFLGFESARNELGISISYWDSLEAISAWREHSFHQLAQEKGKRDWYKNYRIRIARVERDSALGD